MLYWNVRRLLVDKGKLHPNSWLVKHGFSYPRAKQLLSGKAREIKLTQLATLCRYLNCAPNDLFVWKEDEEPLPPNHPMRELINPTNELAVTERLNKLTPNQLKGLMKYLDELDGQAGEVNEK